MSENKKKIAIIAGAGPAGLTAALELLRRTDVKPIVIESGEIVGGIAATFEHNGNHIDVGGHRFFSKNKEIMDWWLSIMPLQQRPSSDDIIAGREDEFEKEGLDPEKTDRVMLRRHRESRILFNHHFFSYPVKLSAATLRSMGFASTMRVGFGFIAAKLHKRPDDTLENFYINRFGRPLYEMFFEHYTEKVWGRHPREIGAEWGAQRVKGLSLKSIIKNMFARKKDDDKDISQKGTETSLIERFIYPKYGPGQMWSIVADEVKAKGGEVLTHSMVQEVNVENGIVKSVGVKKYDGEMETMTCDYFLSSMPLKDLINSLNGIDVPEEVKKTAVELPYRDFITVGVLVDELKMKNPANVPFKGRLTDTWIYIQELDVKVGRLQIFNNWSPYMVKDNIGTVWVGMEYFCNEGDELWQMPEKEFIEMAIGELEHIGLIDAKGVRDSVRFRVKKAYPAYFGTYKQLPCVTDWVDGIENMFCIGRNGQHRYNNMDHSMLTAIEAVSDIAEGKTDKSNVWNVNTEEEYHEEKETEE